MTFRLYPDPEDQCVSCEGRGCRRTFDADLGYDYAACPACGGVATAGRYHLAVHVGELSLGARGPLDSFEEAATLALQIAQQLGVRRGRASHVRVTYRPFEVGGPPEIVFAVGVGAPSPDPAAA